MKPLLALLALIALFAAPATAPAQNPAIPPTTVLFVGNSFVHGAFEPVLSYGTTLVTDENAGLPADNPRSERRGGQTSGPWGGIAAIFETFTREAGLHYDVHVELVSGMPLRYHYEHALDVVAQPKWNVVVLQDLSTGPVLTTKLGSPADFERYTTLLEQAIHRVNPAAKVLLYETFSRADLTYPAGSPYAGKGISVMGDALHDAYYGELHREGHIAGLAPVGDAWLRAIRQGVAEANPYAPEPGKLDLWNVDNYHPSRWGAYLNACVFFATIAGGDPRTLGPGERAAVDLGIAPAQAQTLQRIAYETVSALP